jgi:hypothetical protein
MMKNMATGLLLVLGVSISIGITALAASGASP